MEKINLIYLILGLTLLCSNCDKDEDELVICITNTAPEIINPTFNSNIEITADNLSESFGEITWTQADFGCNSEVSYSVELDLKSNGFNEPVILETISGTNYNSITKASINKILLKKGLDGTGEVQLRILATVDSGAVAIYSSPVTISINTFSTKLYVPGAYQGWDPMNTSTTIGSVIGNNQYEGYININEPTEYRYTDEPSWFSNNYGDNGADGTLELEGENIQLPVSGLIFFTVNLGSLTHTSTKTNWGVVGSASPGGWDNDQNMIYNQIMGSLSITLDLVVGEIKFRANGNDDINLGDNENYGILDYDGAAIPIDEAGNYTIELSLMAPVYHYKITKN